MALSKSVVIPCLALVLLMCSLSEAREFELDGSWKVPSDTNEFNKWAEKNRFEIGDTIVMKYNYKTDSVLQVTEEDYKTCDTSNPIKSYKDGNTKITLKKSGPYFFISGIEGHCKKGQKLEIKVLSAKHSQTSPSKHHHHAPAPAPANGGSGLKAGLWGFAAVMGILALF